MKLAVLASGRGSNLQAILDAVDGGKLKAEIVLVAANNSHAKALERAASKGISTSVVLPADYSSREEYDRALAQEVSKSGAEWVALAGFMRLLSSAFLDFFPKRVINIHPSLLPAFPGLEAQSQAFDYGVKYSGCTVHFVDEDLDHGPIIAQSVVPVLTGDNAESLAGRILVEEHKLYPEVLQYLTEGRVKLEGRKVVIQE